MKVSALVFAAFVLFKANVTAPPVGVLATDQMYLSCFSPALSLPSTVSVAVLPATDVPLVSLRGLAMVGGVFVFDGDAGREPVFDLDPLETI